MTKQTKKLFTEFELIKTNTEDNTFFDYFIKNEYMASKIKAYVLSTAQLKHNVSEKKKRILVLKLHIKESESFSISLMRTMTELLKKLQNYEIQHSLNQ
ncbi:hypothetical protein QYZ44_25785 [Vibrio parahaemolyticus]|nr:hypothetical protein [Vibrio parahaemolyticus]MDN4712174.1 hypothetical protein [Vibrio parahaemolyticus]